MQADDTVSGDQTTKFVLLPTSPPALTGLFLETGKTLPDEGIDMHAIAPDHFLANPTAGVAACRLPISDRFRGPLTWTLTS